MRLGAYHTLVFHAKVGLFNYYAIVFVGVPARTTYDNIPCARPCPGHALVSRSAFLLGLLTGTRTQKSPAQAGLRNVYVRHSYRNAHIKKARLAPGFSHMCSGITLAASSRAPPCRSPRAYHGILERVRHRCRRVSHWRCRFAAPADQQAPWRCVIHRETCR